MGTTVATNALLERRGEPTVPADHARLRRPPRDRLPGPARPLRARHPHAGAPSTARDEVDERDRARRARRSATSTSRARGPDGGPRGAAIERSVADRPSCTATGTPEHERRVADLARDAGFSQVSGLARDGAADQARQPRRDHRGGRLPLPHPASLRGRAWRGTGETSACASCSRTAASPTPASSGGKDSILSRARRAASSARCDTAARPASTAGDLRHGRHVDRRRRTTRASYERSFESVIGGVRLRAPMLHINTVAAGGGSVCAFDDGRYRVGPRSAGADPGPACYGRGGPLAVTDCNLVLGKLQPAFFPRVLRRRRDGPRGRGRGAARARRRRREHARRRSSRRRPSSSPTTSSAWPATPWPGPSSASPRSAGTTSAAPCCAASAAPPGSTPVSWRTRSG